MCHLTPCPHEALLLDGRLELDRALFELRRDGRAVPLEPQAFDVLLHLVTHRDRVVSKEELMDTLWGGRFVTDSAVTSRIKQVRRALGDDGQEQRLVRTQHGRGYRFVGEVVVVPTASAATPGSGGGTAVATRTAPARHLLGYEALRTRRHHRPVRTHLCRAYA